jgi:hypothetical protein
VSLEVLGGSLCISGDFDVLDYEGVWGSEQLESVLYAAYDHFMVTSVFKGAKRF